MRELGNSVCVLHSISLIFIFSIFYILWFVAPLRFTAFVNEGAIKDFKFCLELLQAFIAKQFPKGLRGYCCGRTRLDFARTEMRNTPYAEKENSKSRLSLCQSWGESSSEAHFIERHARCSHPSASQPRTVKSEIAAFSNPVSSVHSSHQRFQVLFGMSSEV